MEENGKLSRGLSLAELKQTKRVQAITKDVRERFEAKWMEAHHQSLLNRQGEEFLRTKTRGFSYRQSKQLELAQLDWMLSSMQTLPIDERIRLEKRLQNKIRDCEQQLRGLVGLPPMFKKPVKRQRIKTEAEAQKRLISQFTKEGILSNLQQRLSKAYNMDSNVEHRRVNKESMFAHSMGCRSEDRQERHQGHTKKQHVVFNGLHLPEIQQNRRSVGLANHNVLLEKYSQDVLAISDRICQLPCNMTPKKRVVVGDTNPILKPHKRKQLRIPVQKDNGIQHKPTKQKSVKVAQRIQLSGFNCWRKEAAGKQQPPEVSLLCLDSSQQRSTVRQLSDRNSSDLYSSLARFEQVYAEQRQSQKNRSRYIPETLSPRHERIRTEH